MSKQKPRCVSKLDEEIGFRIRQIRQNKKLNQTQVAASCNISRQQLRKYELGRDRMSVQKLVQIATFLEVDINEILKPANDKLPATAKRYQIQNMDEAAAILWSKLTCKRKKRMVVELLDILHHQQQT